MIVLVAPGFLYFEGMRTNGLLFNFISYENGLISSESFLESGSFGRCGFEGFGGGGFFGSTTGFFLEEFHYCSP